jgi:hypothetical protein
VRSPQFAHRTGEHSSLSRLDGEHVFTHRRPGHKTILTAELELAEQTLADQHENNQNLT